MGIPRVISMVGLFLAKWQTTFFEILLETVNGKIEMERFISLSSQIILFVELIQFFEECKVVKLKPLYKKNPKTDPKNYSLTMLLPYLNVIPNSLKNTFMT